MQILERLTVSHHGTPREIQLCKGDLTEFDPAHPFDILVVSAFPNDYSPTSTSLIGALYRKGISVARLAKDKGIDLRSSFSCWMSKDLGSLDAGLGFKRILCFEPATRGTAPELVADIFRSLAPFLMGEFPEARVAMPIVASGNQGWSPANMLTHILDAAVHWLIQGLPLRCLKIVEYSSDKAERLRQSFVAFSAKNRQSVPPARGKPQFDAFISYSRVDQEYALHIARVLREANSDIRIFVDQLTLNSGQSWQQEIYESLDVSSKVVALLSPTYLESKVCKEEFNIALFRHRETDSGVLVPVYLKSAALPTYMKLVNYIDCREGDYEKLRGACSSMFGR